MEDESYTLNQIFNADDNLVFGEVNALQDSCLLQRKGQNFTQSKDRITLLTCANTAGICKLPLAFIHKSTRPCCFKHMNMNSLPSQCFSQCKAQMDTTVFGSGFTESLFHMFKSFVKIINKGIECKIILLLVNTLAHPSPDKLTSSDGEVTSTFLPPTQYLFYNRWTRVQLKHLNMVTSEIFCAYHV